MSHRKIRITDEDGTVTEVCTKPEGFDMKIKDDALSLYACWCADELLKEPREYLAVVDAWPGRETLELTDMNGYEVYFTGTVQSVGYEKKPGEYKKKVVFISASEEYGS